MSNTIPLRIAGFLKAFPPFRHLEEAEVLAMARQAVVQYLAPGEILFQKGDPAGDRIYVLREGAVSLYQDASPAPILVDRCDEGDLFGISSLLGHKYYSLTAQASEDSLVYALEKDFLKQLATQNEALRSFLEGMYAADRARKLGKPEGHPLHPLVEAAFTDLSELQLADYSKKPVTCSPELSLREAATIMQAQGVGSILVTDARNFPVGIITDKDFRREVVTGKLPISAPVSRLMSRPVITLRPGLSVAEAQLVMLRHDIHHLCLTHDGSDQSPVVGVLSEHDLLLHQGSHPVIFIREIRRAENTASLCQVRSRSERLLHNYLQQEVSMGFIATVMTAINDALTRRCLELGREELAKAGKELPEADFCWLALGSQGREEQLLRTDQDNALVFASDKTGEARERERTGFLELAEIVNRLLFELGFAYCPAEMMARNPKWCLSLPEWKEQFARWVLEPTPKAIMHSTIFFDFRPLYGKDSLAHSLGRHVFQLLDEESRFLSYLAKDALTNPPPLTFFRNFLVERSGEHKDEFDIKARVMMPLADAARVLALQHRLEGVNNTFRRFESLVKKELNYPELMEQAGEAYEVLMRYRTWRGLQQGDSGRFFSPGDLTKMERLNLRNAFRPIRELQSLLSTRFQLSLLG